MLGSVLNTRALHPQYECVSKRLSDFPDIAASLHPHLHGLLVTADCRGVAS
jgi:hypothetical protein